jgi:hypothetical protein
MFSKDLLAIILRSLMKMPSLVSEKPKGDVFVVGVEDVEDHIRVAAVGSCENHDFVDLAHLLEELDGIRPDVDASLP